MSSLRSIFLLVLLGTASTTLALRIQDELQRSPETPESLEPDAETWGQASEIPEMPKYEPPPIERFAAAFDRPLFSPSRRPPKDEPTPIMVEDRALTATLRGILFSNLEGVAFLSPIGETTVVRVSQGVLYLGWRLLEIHPDYVVFELDGETITLELIYKAQPTPAKRTRPRVRQRS